MAFILQNNTHNLRRMIRNKRGYLKMSTISILLGTQDLHLREMCAPFITSANFYFFDDIHFLSSQIESMKDTQIIIFVDIEWPNNDSGYHIARTIRKRNDQSKVFLLTDRTDNVKEHWAQKVNGEIVERAEETFFSKLAPVLSLAGIAIPKKEINYTQSSERTATAKPQVFERTLVRAPSYERTAVRSPSYEKTSAKPPSYERTAVKAGTSAGINSVALAETELEKILGPMGSLLLQDALVAANGNLSEAIKRVAQFGTTTSEQNQINELSIQFS